ncbi:MAG TPA: TIR domain-containing protein [Thermoplasmata archaeon]|nr:TIR domain-containing protein [Thermoplasmata archaeon]
MDSPVPQPPIPRAFISYSWDGDAHVRWVEDLAARLRHDGVDVTLDRWHVVPGDQLPEFMERAVRDNDFVLIICTPRYKARSDGRTGGVGYEGGIMTAEVYIERNQRKFIPLWRAAVWEEAAPSWLLGKLFIDLRGDPYPERSYEELLRTLHRQRAQAPSIGPRPEFGARGAEGNAGAGTSRAQQGSPDPSGGNLDDQIRAVLRPLMPDRDRRQARLDRAFAAYTGLLDRIAIDGETGVFLSLMLRTLRDYGEVEPGLPAVAVLLESVKGEVGAGDRQRIDQILHAVRSAAPGPRSCPLSRPG